MQNKLIKIYALINPLTDQVFYIGASKNPDVRLTSHIANRNVESGYKTDQLMQILEAGEHVEILILDECEIEKVSFLEEFYIDLFLSFGYPLKQSRRSTYSKTKKAGLFFKTTTSGNIVTTTLRHILPNGVCTYFDQVNLPFHKYKDEEVKSFMMKTANKSILHPAI